ncbi:barstar family protein [Lentzea alba]|uniref:barstar family protein n=1 Tax=Lentzea alba TaxID=2714351 RepID=UPI0039BF18FF
MFRYELVEAVDDEFVNVVAGEVLARAVDVDGWLADALLPERRELVLRGCPIQTPAGSLQLYVWDGDDPAQIWDLVDPVVHARLPGGDLVLSASVCLRDNGPRSRLKVRQPSYGLLQDGDFAGSCRAVEGLPAQREGYRWPSVTLIGCDFPERVRDLETVNDWGGIRALDRDGRPMSFAMIKFVVADVRPSVLRDGLFDVVLDQSTVTWSPDHYPERPGPTSRPVWELWRGGVPREKNLWAPFDSAGRRAWLNLTHDNQRPTDPTGIHHLDGRFATDREGLHLALGEAMAGPGGYFGRNVAELADCLDFTGFTLVWHDVNVADQVYFARVLEKLREYGVTVEFDSTVDAVVELDRLTTLRKLTERWCRAWTKAAGHTLYDGRQPHTQVVHVNQPGRKYERIVTDAASGIGWAAVDTATAPHPEWLTAPTFSPEETTRLIAHEGLRIRPQETLMRRDLAGHPMPSAPDGYEVVVARGEVIEVEIRRNGSAAASGLVAVLGEDAVPHRIETAPGHRRRGLGSVVMGVLMREAMVAGATTGLLFATEDGLHLYRKLGWEAVSDVVIASNS